jgi:hypothetical protein
MISVEEIEEGTTRFRPFDQAVDNQTIQYMLDASIGTSGQTRQLTSRPGTDEPASTTRTSASTLVEGRRRGRVTSIDLDIGHMTYI